MRVWTWRDLPMAGGAQDEGGQLTIGYTVGGEAAFIRCAVFSPFLHGTILDFIVDACNAAEQREAEMQATINAGRLLAHLDDVPCAFCGGSHNYRETHMAVR